MSFLLYISILISARLTGMGSISLAVEDLFTEIRDNPAEAVRIDLPTIFLDGYYHYQKYVCCSECYGEEITNLISSYQGDVWSVGILNLSKNSVAGIKYQNNCYMYKKLDYRNDGLHFNFYSKEIDKVAGLLLATKIREIQIGLSTDFLFDSYSNHRWGRNPYKKEEKKGNRYRLGIAGDISKIAAHFSLLLERETTKLAGSEWKVKLYTMKYRQKITEGISIGGKVMFAGYRDELIDLSNPKFGLGLCFHPSEFTIFGFDVFLRQNPVEDIFEIERVLLGVETCISPNLYIRLGDYGYRKYWDRDDICWKVTCGVGYCLRNEWVFDYSLMPLPGSFADIQSGEHFLGLTYKFGEKI